MIRYHFILTNIPCIPFPLKMKTFIFFLAVCAFLSSNCQALAIWPKPSSLSYGDDARQVDAAFKITLSDAFKSDQDLQSAVERTMGRIQNAAIAPYTIDYGADQAAKATKSSSLKELQVQQGTTSKRNTHIFSTKSTDNDAITNSSDLTSLANQALEHMDESYSLSVPSGQGVAVLKASNALGALRGLTTFSQLVYQPLNNQNFSFVDGVPITIEDKAAFNYRGIMIDTARNYLPPDTIKRQLDAMELVKLNQLHWHITDTSSWPLALQSKGMAVLAEKGSYPNSTYDSATIQDIVDYAGQRGIGVIIEIDMPGHQYMGVKDYPGDLIVCGAKLDWANWANEPPSGQLDIRKPAATQLMKDIFTELAPFLSSPYISTGNDEVEAQCYGFKRGHYNSTDTILAPFVDSVHSHLVSLNKTPMVWEEATLNYPKTSNILKPGTLIEAWTSSANVNKILTARNDTRIVHAPSDYFYLDCGMGDFTGGKVSQSWCDYNPWTKIYSFDPYNGTEGIQNGRERIAGGETPLWAEQVDEANLESLLWPRAASAAEVFWTGEGGKTNDVYHKRNLTEALPRLLEVRGRMRSMGIRAAPLQPQWCTIRPGECNAP